MDSTASALKSPMSTDAFVDLQFCHKKVSRSDIKDSVAVAKRGRKTERSTQTGSAILCAGAERLIFGHVSLKTGGETHGLIWNPSPSNNTGVSAKRWSPSAQTRAHVSQNCIVWLRVSSWDASREMSSSMDCSQRQASQIRR